MRPVWPVILLTTLIGAGQGLFLALFGIDVAARLEIIAAPSANFFAAGCAVSVALLCGGLASSFFHLGRPERTRSAAAMWRSLWLSRELIVLPVFMVMVAAYDAAYVFGWRGAPLIGTLAAPLCVALFLSTAMMCICLKFLQKGHTGVTFVNFLLLGSASGMLLAAAFAGVLWPQLMPQLGVVAGALTTAAALVRGMMLARNALLRPRSTLQSAIGIADPNIAQKAPGAIGESFNTREFSRGPTPQVMHAAKWFFLLAAFALPLALIGMALAQTAPRLLALAFAVQFAGLFAERWFFFEQARHPQNLYYQAIS